MIMYNPAHHQHIRKRKCKTRPYPNVNKKIRILENLVTIISFVFPLTAIPQIYEIWVLKNAQGVSFLTWLLFLLLTIPLLGYAIVHKDKRLKLMWALWLITYAIVLVGLILYK